MSHVETLPATEDTANFLVRWSGSDDDAGSGITDFTIFVSIDGEPFVPWLTSVPFAESIYEGEAGHTYAFSSVAHDNVGHHPDRPRNCDRDADGSDDDDMTRGEVENAAATMTRDKQNEA